ncbi:hypothetical protein TW95_gp0329 [Pandoravirus inopinatum]|uniref:Uncharacterized protein n=1 Tax=Pandoravirus inopinatum TaxID=1605721 RepID=A0A0B5IWI6_9VIRU|nr:hypothetical protein TW95_gp0329 [Pandoravirus inopinatum]AJF97063.1 hypothetical protein [Pandoravirus inopinatum]
MFLFQIDQIFLFFYISFFLCFWIDVALRVCLVSRRRRVCTFSVAIECRRPGLGASPLAGGGKRVRTQCGAPSSGKASRMIDRKSAITSVNCWHGSIFMVSTYCRRPAVPMGGRFAIFVSSCGRAPACVLPLFPR